MGSERDLQPVRIVVTDEMIAREDAWPVLEPVWLTANFYETYEVLEQSLAQFTWPQRLAWAVMWHNAEVCNGGHHQFFWNSTGMIWPEALEGLTAIGRDDMSAILREAVSRFPSPPMRDRDQRIDALEARSIDFDDLDGRYYEAEGELWDALIAFIRKQPAEFRFDGVVFK